MKSSNLIFVCVHLEYYKCCEINVECGKLYIDCSDWIENKKTTQNPINKKYNKSF